MAFSISGDAMTMTTSEIETTAKKRGRPFGIFGPRRRQLQLIAQYVDALGGDAMITPILENAIVRAVGLQSIAEQARKQISRHGAKSASELLALARLEAVANAAVRELNLPITAINTRTDS
jgi:hypothetical protein